MSLSPRRTVAVNDLTTLEAIRNVEVACVGLTFIDHEGNFVYDSRYKRAIEVSSHYYVGTAGDAPRRSVAVIDAINLEILRNIEMGVRSHLFIDESGNFRYASRFKRQL